MSAQRRYLGPFLANGPPVLRFDWLIGWGMGWRCSYVLGGPRYQLAEFSGGPKRPIGITEQLPAQQYEIGLAGTYDVIGLSRRGYQPHGAGPAPCFPADLLGEGRLIPSPDGYPGVRVAAAR